MILILLVRGPHFAGIKGTRSGRAGLFVNELMHSFVHKLTQQVFTEGLSCALCRCPLGLGPPSYLICSVKLQHSRQAGGTSKLSSEAFSLTLTSVSRDGFGLLAWPSSGWNQSPASYLIEAFVLPSHNILILIIGPFCFFPNYITHINS